LQDLPCSEANMKRVELSCEDINSSLVHLYIRIFPQRTFRSFC